MCLYYLFFTQWTYRIQSMIYLRQVSEGEMSQESKKLQQSSDLKLWLEKAVLEEVGLSGARTANIHSNPKKSCGFHLS